MKRQSSCIADGCGKRFDVRGPEGNPFSFAQKYCPACVTRLEKTRVSEPIVNVPVQSKHTPGPWDLSHDTGNGFNVAHEIAPNCGHLLVIAECATQKSYLGYEITRETAQANAHLIASAPDMLNALELAETTILRLAKTDSANGTLDVIRAAIAKAEGK